MCLWVDDDRLIFASKNCEDKFTEVATSPRFNFVGNIDLGNDLPLAALKPHYDAILFAYGASQDKELGIPGEKALRSVYSARAFVGWYNGLPEHRDLQPDLTSGEDAVIVGQGNVALDVARILLSDVDTLRRTDIADYAVETLSKSRIKRVRVVGRRGPLQVDIPTSHSQSIQVCSNKLHILGVFYHQRNSRASSASVCVLRPHSAGCSPSGGSNQWITPGTETTDAASCERFCQRSPYSDQIVVLGLPSLSRLPALVAHAPIPPHAHQIFPQ